MVELTVPLWWWEQVGLEFLGYQETAETAAEVREKDEGGGGGGGG